MTIKQIELDKVIAEENKNNNRETKPIRKSANLKKISKEQKIPSKIKTLKT